MMTNDEKRALMFPFHWVAGEWQGAGAGEFPTIKSFEYKNKIRFNLAEDAFGREYLIHFEEKAWVKNEQGNFDFMHWEVGFIKPNHDGRIQLYVCHNTGRIEITYGNFIDVNQSPKEFKLRFYSDSIRNDYGLTNNTKSLREIELKEGELISSLAMATSEVAELKTHLRSSLKRIQI